MNFSDFSYKLSKKEINFIDTKHGIKFIQSLLERGLKPSILRKDSKSDVVSAALRSEGNEKLKLNKNELKSVLLKYTKALFNSVSNIEQAFCYGNRSSILFRKGLYEECIIDIDRALKLGYPEEKSLKLKVRKGDSFIMLARYDEALEIFENLLKSNDKNLNVWLKRIEEGVLKAKSQKKDDTNNKAVSVSLNYPLIQNQLESVCNEASAFSSKLELKENESDGRGVYAKEDISVGEVLAIEKPFSYRITQDNFLTHCYFCMKRCFNIIPCLGCNQVGFCNDSCYDEAINTLKHHFECGILTEILSTNYGDIGLLAYGTVIQNDLYDVQKAVVNYIDGTCNPMNIDSLQYKCALAIVTNESKRSLADLKERYIAALYLMFCMKEKFKSLKEDENPETAVYVAYAISQHLQGIPCNAHSLTESLVSSGTDDSNFTYSTYYTTSAIYPCLSLLNHSCSPNVVRITKSMGVCEVKALLPISKGEQLFDNYSFHYATHSYNDRQHQLSVQYLFSCRCEACSKKWALFEDIILKQNLKVIWKCKSCGPEPVTLSDVYRCNKCNKEYKEECQKLKLMQKDLHDYLDALMNGKYQDNRIESFLCNVLTLADQFVLPPHAIFNQTTEMLKMIWNLHGNFVTDIL